MTLPLVILSGALGLLAVICLYLTGRTSRSLSQVHEWQARCEELEQTNALFNRHLAVLAQVIHKHGGGVVNRYYETSALRFLLAKQASSAVVNESNAFRWLRLQCEFLHALADGAAKVGTTDEIRRRIDGVRAAHPSELAAYDSMALASASSDWSHADVSPPASLDDALDVVEREAMRFLTQVIASLAFAGRVAGPAAPALPTFLGWITRLCEQDFHLLEAGDRRSAPQRVESVLKACETITDIVKDDVWAEASAMTSVPSAGQIAQLRVSALRCLRAEEAVVSG